MPSKLFKSPTEVFEAQLNDLFLKENEVETNKVVQAFSLILSRNFLKSREIIDLYKLLGLDNFVSVITLFEKKTVTFPSKEEIKDAIILAVIYYYREILGYSWDKIKHIIPFEFSSISYAFKIKDLNKFTIQKLKEILKEEENNEKKGLK